MFLWNNVHRIRSERCEEDREREREQMRKKRKTDYYYKREQRKQYPIFVLLLLLYSRLFATQCRTCSECTWIEKYAVEMKTDRCLCWAVYVLTVSHTVPVFLSPEEKRSQRLTDVSSVLEIVLFISYSSPLSGWKAIEWANEAILRYT